jgi:hypothetical protein
MGENKETNPPRDWVNIGSGLVLSIGGPALTYWFGFGPDVFVAMLWAMLLVVLPAGYFIGRRWKRHSHVRLAGGEPHQVPLIPAAYFWWFISVEIGTILLFIVVWLFCWDTLFAVATIESFQRSELTSASGTSFIDRGPVDFVQQDESKEKAGWAVTVDLHKATWPETVKVRAVRVIAVRSGYVYLQSTQSGPTNLIEPFTFRAKVPVAGGTARAVLQRDGHDSEGIVSLNKDNSFGRLHIDVTSEPGGSGIFLIDVEIDVSDGQGRRALTLRTNERIPTYVMPSNSPVIVPQPPPGGIVPQPRPTHPPAPQPPPRDPNTAANMRGM